MIIFLYGPDIYRRQEKLKSIVSEYKAKRENPSLQYFDFKEEEKFDEFRDFAKSGSLFDNKKMAVVRNSLSLEKDNLKEYKNILKRNLKTEDTILVIDEEKTLPRDFDFLPKEPAVSQEFENFEGMELQRFIIREAKKRGISLDGESRELLVGAYKGDSWGLITELDKLALLDEKKITYSILERHLTVAASLNIFNALDKIRAAYNIGQKLSVLEELFFRSQEPAMIFNRLSVSPYAERDFKVKMADYDAAVKSGKLEYEEALLSICLGIQ